MTATSTTLPKHLYTSSSNIPLITYLKGKFAKSVNKSIVSPKVSMMITTHTIESIKIIDQIIAKKNLSMLRKSLDVADRP